MVRFCIRQLDRVGQFDKAIDFIIKNLNISRKLRDNAGEGKAFELGFGVSVLAAFLKLGQFDKAIEW